MAILHSFVVSDFIDSLIGLFAAFVLGTQSGTSISAKGGLRTNVLVAIGVATFVDISMRLNGHPGTTRLLPTWSLASDF